MKRYQIVTS